MTNGAFCKKKEVRNRQIVKIFDKIEQAKRMFRLSYEELLKLFGIASTTYRRWKNRIKKALQPVQHRQGRRQSRRHGELE